MTGTSRAPSIAAFFLMKAHQQRLDEAYAYIKMKRPSVKFNPRDAERLQEAEIMLFGQQASGFIIPVGQDESPLTSLTVP